MEIVKKVAAVTGDSENTLYITKGENIMVWFRERVILLNDSAALYSYRYSEIFFEESVEETAV